MFAYVARPICLFRYSFADMKVSAARQFSRRIRKDSLSRRSLRASSVEIGPAGVFLIALYKLSASSLEVALSRVLCKAQYIDAYHSSGQSGCAGGVAGRLLSVQQQIRCPQIRFRVRAVSRNVAIRIAKHCINRCKSPDSRAMRVRHGFLVEEVAEGTQLFQQWAYLA